ncbi:MAG: BON domain-containing protein, partial [Pirellulales bacterium]|nr:BON domain-containing protein [Pirellulales bacterium]
GHGNMGERTKGPLSKKRVVTEEDLILDDVNRALASSGRFPSGMLEVSASSEAVKLEGRVVSYYQKQVAQAATLPFIGSRQLINEIEVG